MKLKHLLGSLLLAATVSLGATEAAVAVPGMIVGQQQGTRVNLRTGPSVGYSAPSYGLVGQEVEVLGRAFDRDSASWWFEVMFYESGATGWMHEDFIQPYYPLGDGG